MLPAPLVLMATTNHRRDRRNTFLRHQHQGGCTAPWVQREKGEQHDMALSCGTTCWNASNREAGSTRGRVPVPARLLGDGLPVYYSTRLAHGGAAQSDFSLILDCRSGRDMGLAK